MQIHRESPNKHTIKSYSDTQIIVNQTSYVQNVIISSQDIIPNWNINSIDELDDARIQPILELNLKIILIGFNQPNARVPTSIIATLANQRIAIESMSIGAACRTFNMLLTDDRAVVLGIVF